jgi:hypothetical protein
MRNYVRFAANLSSTSSLISTSLDKEFVDSMKDQIIGSTPTTEPLYVIGKRDGNGWAPHYEHLVFNDTFGIVLAFVAHVNQRLASSPGL